MTPNELRALPLRERLLAQATITLHGCWEWTGRRDKDGYGIAKLKGKSRRAHRLIWQATFGTIPDRLLICHQCDNPPCIRPDHLFLGTPKGNIQFSVARGRHAILKNRKDQPGEKNGQAKLSRADVMLIAKSKNGSRKVAAEFGISKTQVLRIRRGQSWSFLHSPTALKIIRPPQQPSFGNQLPHAKLTDDYVRAIRRDTRQLRFIAEQYGVSISTISLVKRKIHWGHVIDDV